MPASARKLLDPELYSQTVYSCLFPQTQLAVEKALSEFPVLMLRDNISPGLDKLHEPLLDLYQEMIEKDNQASGFSDFENRYFVNGSSEGSFHLLQRERASQRKLYRLEGEYQGFSAYAESCGLESIDVAGNAEAVLGLEPGLFFVSNPSSRDGNVLPDSLWQAILAKHQVVLDIAYLGMTEPVYLDLSSEAIIAVCGSLSKPFGLYYFRVGFLWSRDPLLSLYGNRWFKNACSIELAKSVLDKISFSGLRQEGQSIQAQAVKELGLDKSDVYLLANSSESIHKAMRRAPELLARLCLTPYFYKEFKNA